MANTPNLKKLYQDEVAPALMQKFGYKSTMQIPRLEKIVVNVGCSEARENAKVLDAVVGDLTKITGQKAIITKPRSPWLTSSCVRVCPSARRSPCAATACGSSWTACSTWPCPASATSAASTPTPLTAAATTAGHQGAADLPRDRVRQD